MERLRSDRLRACGRLIQKMVRGWLARQRYLKLQRTARCIQTFGRGMMARRFVGRLLVNVYDFHTFPCSCGAQCLTLGNKRHLRLFFLHVTDDDRCFSQSDTSVLLAHTQPQPFYSHYAGQLVLSGIHS